MIQHYQTGQVISLSCGHPRTVAFNDAHDSGAQFWCDRCDGMRPVGPDLSALAAMTANAVAGADFSALDFATVTALEVLFRAVTHDRCHALAERRKQLWVESAIVVPAGMSWSRTVIVNPDVNPDLLGRMALVRRTDTGRFYLISISPTSGETITVATDAAGTWGHDYVLAATGSRLTRADAITIINDGDTETLETESERSARWAAENDD